MRKVQVAAMKKAVVKVIKRINIELTKIRKKRKRENHDQEAARENIKIERRMRMIIIMKEDQGADRIMMIDIMKEIEIIRIGDIQDHDEYIVKSLN